MVVGNGLLGCVLIPTVGYLMQSPSILTVAFCEMFLEFSAVSVVGLFPYFLNDTWPIYCNPSERYQAERINDLRDLLHEKLIGQYRQNDEVLWEDLWNMHGTCTHLTQPDYFNIVLQLSLKYDLEVTH